MSMVLAELQFSFFSAPVVDTCFIARDIPNKKPVWATADNLPFVPVSPLVCVCKCVVLALVQRSCGQLFNLEIADSISGLK